MANSRVLAGVVFVLCVMSCTQWASSPCTKTYYALRSTRSAITFYEREHGVYPERLDDLVAAGFVLPPEAFVDPWGERCVYRRLSSGYELFSKGGDRVAGTADDIVPDVAPMRCVAPRVWGGCLPDPRWKFAY